MLEDNKSFFRGKVLLIYLAEGHEDYTGGVVLHRPEIKKLNGRLFIHGDAYNTTSFTSIPFDQVAAVFEFSTEREFLAKTPSFSE